MSGQRLWLTNVKEGDMLVFSVENNGACNVHMFLGQFYNRNELGQFCRAQDVVMCTPRKRTRTHVHEDPSVEVINGPPASDDIEGSSIYVSSHDQSAEEENNSITQLQELASEVAALKKKVKKVERDNEDMRRQLEDLKRNMSRN